MKCKVCGENFPSRYYFKTEDICINCFNVKNPEIKIDEKNTNADIPKSRLASVLNGILSFFYFLIIVATIGVTISLIGAQIEPEKYQLNSLEDFQIIYKMSLLEQKENLISTNADFTILGIQELATISFTTKNRFALLMLFVTAYVFLAFSFIIILQLKKFLKSIEIGQPFQKENVNTIRIVAYAMIAEPMISLLGISGFTYYLYQPVQIENTRFTIFWMALFDKIPDAFWQAFYGLVILLIAEIFRLGTKLKEEQALTV